MRTQGSCGARGDEDPWSASVRPTVVSSAFASPSPPNLKPKPLTLSLAQGSDVGLVSAFGFEDKSSIAGPQQVTNERHVWLHLT